MKLAEGIVRAITKLTKKILPFPAKKIVKKIIQYFQKRPIKPYLKRKSVEGVTFDFWIADRSGRNWYDLHCTDPIWLEMRFMRERLIMPDDVVFECGSHHGCSALLLASWVGKDGKVVCFEALPDNFKILKRNIELNRLTNVILEMKAVGSERGKIKISNESNSSVVLAGKGAEVELTCLDEYHYYHPTVLKIDVEGFEVQVLKGARRILSKLPKLAIEIHTEALSRYGSSPEDIFKLIGVENYKFWIQWDDRKQPEEYDLKTPIKKRVHLFCIPQIDNRDLA